MKTTYIALFFIAALALAAAVRPAPLTAQANTRLEEQSFDYDPDAGKKTTPPQQLTVETTFEDAVTVIHPVDGPIMYSKYRWKNWVIRALYLVLINVALLAIILSLPKTEENYMIAAYFLSGVGFALSFWLFLCAVLILQLKATAWLYMLPVSAASAIVGYTVLMKIKKYDISPAELKESFKGTGEASSEDQRFGSVEGKPGDWPDQDFTK